MVKIEIEILLLNIIYAFTSNWSQLAVTLLKVAVVYVLLGCDGGQYFLSNS